EILCTHCYTKAQTQASRERETNEADVYGSFRLLFFSTASNSSIRFDKLLYVSYVCLPCTSYNTDNTRSRCDATAAITITVHHAQEVERALTSHVCAVEARPLVLLLLRTSRHLKS
ncbi:unnamed protein product, partial [Laminaria digitata]